MPKDFLPAPSAPRPPKRDWLGNECVPKNAKEYQVVYYLDCDESSDRHRIRGQPGNIHKPFDRIAVFVEFQDRIVNTHDVLFRWIGSPDNLAESVFRCSALARISTERRQTWMSFPTSHTSRKKSRPPPETV